MGGATLLSGACGESTEVPHHKARKLAKFRQERWKVAALGGWEPRWSACTAVPTTSDAQFAVAVAHLAKMKAAKPRAEQTLRSSLHGLFEKERSESHVSALFALLCTRGIVKIEGAKVSYALPSASQPPGSP